MALQRAGRGTPATQETEAADAEVTPGSGPAQVATGMVLSTRDVRERPCLELGVVYGRALGQTEPILEALSNLESAAQAAGCDAVLGVRLMPTPMRSGTGVIAYGTGVRWMPPRLPERRPVLRQPANGGDASAQPAAAPAS